MRRREERDGEKASINATRTLRKISFRRREGDSKILFLSLFFYLSFAFSLSLSQSLDTHKEAIIMCVHSRARSHGREHDAHAQFRRNKRELSRRREKHQKTRRAQSDGAAKTKGGHRGRRRRRRREERTERENKTERQKRREREHTAGIKGETDTKREEGKLCEKQTEKKRRIDVR